MKNSETNPGLPASELISKRIADLADWRGDTLARMRKLIRDAVALNAAGKAKPVKKTKI